MCGAGRAIEPGAGRGGGRVPLIFSGLYISPIRFRKEAYKSREDPAPWEGRAVSGRGCGGGGKVRRAGGGNTKAREGELRRTIARWKSGFPLLVLAKRVN